MTSETKRPDGWAKIEADTIRPYGPGKFDTMLDAYVYAVSMDGGPDEEIASVPDTGRWYGLMRDGTTIFRDNDPTLETLTPAERDYLRVQAGVIISEDSDGFVHVEYFETDAELADAWSEVEAAHVEVTAADVVAEWNSAMEHKRVERDGEAARMISTIKRDERGAVVSEALQDAIREAHAGALPDDWAFATAAAILESWTDLDDLDEDSAREDLPEPDVYTADLLGWAGSGYARSNGFVDEAMADLGPFDSHDQLLMAAQAIAIDSIAGALWQAVEAEVEARNDA